MQKKGNSIAPKVTGFKSVTKATVVAAKVEEPKATISNTKAAESLIKATSIKEASVDSKKTAAKTSKSEAESKSLATSKEVVASVVEKVEPKTVVKAPDKTSEKKTTAKTTTKATKKAAPKKTTTAKTTTTKAKATRSKSTSKSEIIVQYQNCEINIELVEEHVKAQFMSEGHKASEFKNTKIYVKPEEYSAYYVVNDKFSGRVDLF
ncbi:hypothetical protein SAMN04487761_10229 [Lachnospiraceae bacterium C7]|nr:hypothetical protein SAMN04487761_10229 [Lachnospiraceae bacterium C7]